MEFGKAGDVSKLGQIQIFGIMILNIINRPIQAGSILTIQHLTSGKRIDSWYEVVFVT